MKKQLILLFTLIFTGIFSAAAQDPIYVVNGQVVSDIRNIPPGDIESTEMLPADEQTIARYGTEASNGVILITLRYDTPARFPEADGSFNDYISKQTDWDDSLPAARVVLRYKITTDGRTVPTDELEATDRRLRRRVIDAVEKAPRWKPAMRDGKPVESEGVLRVQLPEGKSIPRPLEFIMRTHSPHGFWPSGRTVWGIPSSSFSSDRPWPSPTAASARSSLCCVLSSP